MMLGPSTSTPHQSPPLPAAGVQPVQVSPSLHPMAHSNHHYQVNILVAVAVAAAAFLAVGEASCVGFNLHHRSSPVVRKWAEARGHPALAAQLPAKGSPEYYSELSRHDRALLSGRGIAGGGDGLLTFADGNLTYEYLGYLYYAEVALGTPNATFLVALDTGSDLFWVPCDCKQCASIRNATGQNAPQLRPYSPRLSSTSKPVTCDNALCDDRRKDCSAAATNGSCPYAVRYASAANSSSSGVLVQDVLHLTREGGPGATQPLKASVVFGCGQVQTGALLDGGAAFDGLLGLGMGKVSVPSVLASSGLVASNSFSMCFGDDVFGRINFGDIGSPDQSETPFIVRSTHSTYDVNFTSINVDNKSMPVEFTAVVDSGASFTYLSDPEYTELATNFNSQIREKRTNFSSGFAFEFCYEVSPNQTEVLIPDVSLTAKGGALFPVTDPIIFVTNVTDDGQQGRTIGYCLAILKANNGISINIVGQNFMTGLKVVFDRQRSVLGWQKFDCYKNARVADTPDLSPSPAPAP